MCIGIFCTYYKGVNDEWVLVEKEYTQYSSIEEMDESSKHYIAAKQREGYYIAFKGNSITFISVEEKIVAEYYKCEPMILTVSK